MALVLGTNCGFVTTAPTSDPSEATETGQIRGLAIRHTSSANATKITEIGWWCDNATTDANFQVGLYSDDSGLDPAVLLFSTDFDYAKGTTSGWKSGAVDWDINPSTIYWIAYSAETSSPGTLNQRASSGGDGRALFIAGGLPPTDSSWSTDQDGMQAIYAVFEEETGTNLQINIGDVWKEIPAVQINIGDVWKPVEGMQINIGDAWKTIF